MPFRALLSYGPAARGSPGAAADVLNSENGAGGAAGAAAAGGFAGGPWRAPGAYRAEAKRERGGNISRRLEAILGHSGPSGGHPRRGGTADATLAPGRACPTPVGPPRKAKLFFLDVHIIKQQSYMGTKTTGTTTTGTTKEKETYRWERQFEGQSGSSGGRGGTASGGRYGAWQDRIGETVRRRRRARRQNLRCLSRFCPPLRPGYKKDGSPLRRGPVSFLLSKYPPEGLHNINTEGAESFPVPLASPATLFFRFSRYEMHIPKMEAAAVDPCGGFHLFLPKRREIVIAASRFVYYRNIGLFTDIVNFSRTFGRR